MRITPRRGIGVAAATAALVIPLATAAPAAADPGLAALARTVTVRGVENHLRHLQRIADAGHGTRAAGTPGYTASRDYVAGVLRKAGYTVTLQEFPRFFTTELSTAVLQRVSPDPRTFTPTPPRGGSLGEFATMAYSGSGDVTAPLRAVDLVLPPGPAPNTSTSGCEAADFAGFTAGDLALVQRGTCNYRVKALNAQAAGARGVIIFNEGQPGRTGTERSSLLGVGVDIPVVTASFAAGEELARAAAPTVRLRTDVVRDYGSYNVIAESRFGDPDKVVQFGAHLDGVDAGPGVNDNGSGSAAVLEVAARLGRIPTRNRLRFSFWGAEEYGLVGSQHYVANLSAEEKARIRLYLNFDMVGSPNYALKIYDGDDSDATGGPAGPPGSDEIEKLFEKYFDTLGQGHVGTDLDARSDHDSFAQAGIPVGGLFTGAEELKTPAEQALFGGTAGVPYDSCYHEACDDIDNVNGEALALNTGAIATAALVYGFARDLPGPDTRPVTVARTLAPAAHDDHAGAPAR
ncbi:aminopeptidase [Sphaerisporangium siamense]|uniref:Aminopeptidase Y n=1 Tax=Sphaerisporangium siamense TaxID=795645 RepID=A0A7W7D6E4_9ACTN|nr:M28 family metallopeptidase [Sphaerisporangium siamense]MBB4700819.1 aminopeptidase Y [Sphaerisporangium siamense]GII86035.1 aminopeptidase [Sphaerisporangium siamense]